MMDRIVGESHLEFAVKDFQLGADFVHRAFIDLHEVDEFGNLLRGKLFAEFQIAQPRFHLSNIDAVMSVKYHD